MFKMMSFILKIIKNNLDKEKESEHKIIIYLINLINMRTIKFTLKKKF
jgi:hypothetical protein